MTQAQARQRALEAVGALEDDSDELVGLGEKNAIPSRNGTVYSPFPQPMARNRGVTPRTPAEAYFNPAGNALVKVPVVDA
jgi:hypothetical protein